MQYYVGTQIIQATPMTRGDYAHYRGWELPEEENATEPGYLIEHQNGLGPNHPDHLGYISWVPQSVFNSAYILAGDLDHLKPHEQRLYCEYAALTDKIRKLRAFTDTDQWDALDEEDQVLLAQQLYVMDIYAHLLHVRMSRIHSRNILPFPITILL